MDAGSEDCAIVGVKDGIRYEIARDDHLVSVGKLWKSDFRRREPLILAAGGFSSRSDDEVNGFLGEIVASNLSLVAIDVATSELVGYRLSGIKRKTDKEEQTTMKILMYLNDLKRFDVFEKYGVDEVMEFIALTVKESHARKGIAKELVNRSLQLAKARNLQVAIVTATNIITVKMFERMGFESLRELSIEDYTIDGVRAFPNATPGQFGRFYAKKL